MNSLPRATTQSCILKPKLGCGIIRKGKHDCDFVTVLLSEEGKGVGRLLVKQVTGKADETGRECCLECSYDGPNTKIML